MPADRGALPGATLRAVYTLSGELLGDRDRAEASREPRKNTSHHGSLDLIDGALAADHFAQVNDDEGR